MDNLQQHLSHQPELLIIFLTALVTVIFSVPYFLDQRKRYGSYFEFSSQSRKFIASISGLVCIGIVAYGLTPYVASPTDEVALVLGNTQNSPYPAISEDVSAAIEGTMLQHKGDDVYELTDSIKIISAVKRPVVISLDTSEMKLKEVGNNSSNAKRSAELNIQAIEEKLRALPPTDNGANYFEAILKARDNVRAGSRIIVIGSGLSDSGDLNFSKSNLLTNEQERGQAIDKIREKYGGNYLDNYTIEFYGLGDTVAPQEALSSKQKEIIRSIYKQVVRALGGESITNTKTMTGDSVNTQYVVGTTDTGCGDVGLVFDDNNLKFVSNQAIFTDQAVARESLMSIKSLWDKYSDTIQQIQIDGYIAHYPGADSLSQQRADLVKKMLVDMGIPSDKIIATGRGFGPYQQDTQNRMVKVMVNRNSELCEN